MAASIPHQYFSAYANISTELCSFPLNNMVPSMSLYDDTTNSPVSVASFPDQQAVDVPQLSEMFDVGFCDFAAYDQYNQQHYQVFEPGDVCCGLVPKYSCGPAYSMPAQNNWAIQGKLVSTKVEGTTPEVKVGRYSVEEKKDRILRYLKKRNHRNFNKTIKYACRKTLADKRVRIRGRFAKNNERCEEDHTAMNTIHATPYEQINSFCDDTFQMKYEEDDWLQTAVANLVNLPYLTS
ncbi:hypothetical protein CDL12_17634 [Handroanthus impetiginosus]|uniref:CCT domain-containing protein n=1 Tax=Handroanthus impetiginosus TaxID=429701 RepID=A0A2G9GXP5_9LAMI|nr:hypothetical protein CDL12_17634 [Handroanthus impetiginosus]